MKNAIALALLALLSGCAEMASGLMTYADQANGTYYEDQHYSDRIGEGECLLLLEYGIANNQAYARMRNIGDVDATGTINWNSGLRSEEYLVPGETGQFFYMSPSIQPDRTDLSCPEE